MKMEHYQQEVSQLHPGEDFEQRTISLLLRQKPVVRPIRRRWIAAAAAICAAAAALALWIGIPAAAPIHPPETSAAETNPPATAPAAETEVLQEVFTAKLRLSGPPNDEGWNWVYHLTPEEGGQEGYIEAVKGDKKFRFMTIFDVVEGVPDGEGGWDFPGKGLSLIRWRDDGAANEYVCGYDYPTYSIRTGCIGWSIQKHDGGFRLIEYRFGFIQENNETPPEENGENWPVAYGFTFSEQELAAVGIEVEEYARMTKDFLRYNKLDGIMR
ncbi:MAG: hypothetical protein FWE80_04245 [Oscillospiraceae bacterium]|nr:hypothetical protein [Oscillospiraceae bacterium]